MTTKNTANFGQNFLLPKGWWVEKTTHYKLYCPLAKTGFKIDFGQKKKLRGQQSLAKAIGFKNQALSVLDTTAGWLKDAFLMAQMGCQVKAIESHPFVFDFSKASLELFYSKQGRDSQIVPFTKQLKKEKIKKSKKAKSSPVTCAQFLFSGSLELLFGDSVSYLNSLKNYKDYPDVIFIDPMFGGRKKSTSKKELKILQELTNGNNNKEKLFETALLKAKKKVVVKRHKLDKTLKAKPLVCFKGQSECYDVFQPKREALESNYG